jgi:TonB family protein
MAPLTLGGFAMAQSAVTVPDPLAHPPMTWRSIVRLQCGLTVDALDLPPPTSGWTVAEQTELCKSLDAGDAAALATLTELANKRTAWALRVLAEYSGRLDSPRIPHDPAKALEFYRAAAEQGDLSAQLMLGLMYSTGDGAAIDPTQARVWMQKAIEQGNDDARTALGEMLRDGRGGDADMAKALALFNQAADNGEQAAMYDLAAVYAKGQGVPVDRTQAYKWMGIVAHRGGDGPYTAAVVRTLDTLGKQMTPAQIEEAKKLAAAWESAHPLTAHQFPPAHIDAWFDQSKPCAAPAYPAASKPRGEHGVVKVRLHIGADGKLSRQELYKSSGFPALDQALQQALFRCAFLPALRRGEPIEGFFDFEYTWR